LAGLGALLAASSTLTAAAPPIPNIPEDLLKSELLSVYKDQIDARVKYWREQFLIAPTNRDIIAARQGLAADYRLYDSPYYRTVVAEKTNQYLMDILTGKALKADDDLARLRRINVAMALAKMTSSKLQQAFEIMVQSDDPALRYLGWRGYARNKLMFLASPEGSSTLIASAEKTMNRKSNPLILTEVFRTMTLVGGSDRITPSRRKSLDEQFLKIIQPNWPDLRKTLMEAEQVAAFTEMEQAANALGTIGHDLAGDNQSSRVIAQMLVDLAYTASKRYRQLYDQRDSQEFLLLACSQVLEACEQALIAVSGQDTTRIAPKLDLTQEIASRADAIELAILNWAEALKPIGVKDPTPIAPAE
jgi:hypothetical protein